MILRELLKCCEQITNWVLIWANKNQIRDILHVLGGCDDPQIQGDAIGDAKLKQLSSADRSKFLEEINPKPIAGNFASKFVDNLGEIIKNLRKITQTDLWVAKYENKSLVLPSERGVQYIKARGNKNQGETPRFYFGSEKIQLGWNYWFIRCGTNCVDARNRFDEQSN